MFQQFRMRFFFCLFITIAVLCTATLTQGAIYQWVSTTQGIQQSSTLCPDGANVSAGPNASLSNIDLTQAYIPLVDLTNTDLTKTNLTLAYLYGAVFNNAEVSGANFSYTTPLSFSLPQLQSTASYQQKDLSGIGLSGNNLTDWDLSGQDLSSAYF